jgi:hypothetical protein
LTQHDAEKIGLGDGLEIAVLLATAESFSNNKPPGDTAMSMMLNLLRAALNVPPGSEDYWGRAVMLLGDPGTGKTKTMKPLGAAFGHYRRLSPAESGEGQFGVVPVPGADGYLDYPPPRWVQEFENGGLLFLDEISSAFPALQAPLLGAVQLHVLGSHTFGPRVRVIGAANETADAAGGWDLSPALCNRFGWLDFEGLPAQEWAGGLLSGFAPDATAPMVDAAVEEQRVLSVWPGFIAEARGLVSAFIQRRPELLHKRPAKGSKDRAWPSRRSCDYATEMYASAKAQHLTESETDVLMAAYVGETWVSEFRSWLVLADLPPPASVLDGEIEFRHDVRRLDRTLAVLSACASLVIPETAADRKARGEKMWELVGAVLNDAADVCVPVARELLKANVGAHTKASPRTKACDRLLPLLTAAGFSTASART